MCAEWAHVAREYTVQRFSASRARIAENLCTVYSRAVCAHSAHIEKKLL